MKYPESFTLVDRRSGLTLEVKYDQTTGTYMLNYGNGFKGFHKEHYIDDLISAYYGIKPEKSHQYHDNFSFTHDTTTQMYDMVKLPYHNLWGCSMHGDTFGVGVTGATYTANEIAEHFAKGHWREVKAEEATKERDLVFPLIVRGTLPPYYRHKLTKGSKKSFVSSESLDGAYTKVDSVWTDEFVKNHIKEGHWIVEEVGSQEASEPTTSPPTDNSARTIKVESQAVLESSERFERLASAIEAVNISLESFQTIFADVQEMIAPKVECTGLPIDFDEIKLFYCEEK